MFENLTDRLSATLKNLRGQGRLSEDNIRDSLREVRLALLEADVALPVVKEFIGRVQIQALGQETTVDFLAQHKTNAVDPILDLGLEIDQCCLFSHA